MDELIKLQDFAREKNVTDRAIYKHINNYKKELKGHVYRKGRSGTWLDPKACEIISSKMTTQPVVLVDDDIQKKYDDLNTKYQVTLEELNAKNNMIISFQSQITTANQKMIEADFNREKLEKRIEELEDELEQEKNKSFLKRLFKL